MDHRMIGGPRPGGQWTCLRLLVSGCCTVLCMAVSVSPVFGQVLRSPGSEPETCDTEAGGPADSVCEGFPGCLAGLDSEYCPPFDEEVFIAEDDEYGPRPRLFCFEPEIRVDPVWQGSPMPCVFELCNLGTADLHVGIKT